jgi:hypothetical protein
MWRKIRKSATAPVLAAVHFGDNVAKVGESRQHVENVTSSPILFSRCDDYHPK